MKKDNSEPNVSTASDIQLPSTAQLGKRPSQAKDVPNNAKAKKIDLTPEIRMDNVEKESKDYTLKRNKVRPFLNGLGVSISFDLSLSDSILKQNLELVDLEDLFNIIFQDILDLLRKNAQEKSLVKIVIFQDELESPLVVPLMALRKLNPSIILEKIEHLSQSKKGVKADESLEI